MLGENFDIQGYNGSEYVCICWSGTLVQLLVLCVEQARRRVLFLGEQEISGSKGGDTLHSKRLIPLTVNFRMTSSKHGTLQFCME